MARNSTGSANVELYESVDIGVRGATTSRGDYYHYLHLASDGGYLKANDGSARGGTYRETFARWGTGDFALSITTSAAEAGAYLNQNGWLLSWNPGGAADQIVSLAVGSSGFNLRATNEEVNGDFADTSLYNSGGYLVGNVSIPGPEGGFSRTGRVVLTSGGEIDLDLILAAKTLQKNSAWTTTVGGYTLTLTNNGGFSIVDANGLSATFSGGVVNLTAVYGPDDCVTNVTLDGEAVSASYDGGMLGANANVSMGYNGIRAFTTGGNGNVELVLDNDTGDILVNSSAITQIPSSFDGTSLGIAELAGGVKYICQSALTALSIGSAAPGCNAAFLFTLANGAVVTPPGNVPLFGVSAYTPGSRYVMAVNGDMAVVAEAVEV